MSQEIVPVMTAQVSDHYWVALISFFANSKYYQLNQCSILLSLVHIMLNEHDFETFLYCDKYKYLAATSGCQSLQFQVGGNNVLITWC